MSTALTSPCGVHVSCVAPLLAVLGPSQECQMRMLWHESQQCPAGGPAPCPSPFSQLSLPFFLTKRFGCKLYAKDCTGSFAALSQTDPCIPSCDVRCMIPPCVPDCPPVYEGQPRTGNVLNTDMLSENPRMLGSKVLYSVCGGRCASYVTPQSLWCSLAATG